MDILAEGSRVTFEAGNNVDFRLGTPKYRYTRIAQIGDMALISRISEYNYEVRIFRQGSSEFNKLSPYATNFIGNRQKRLGYITNKRLEETLGIKLISKKEFNRLLN